MYLQKKNVWNVQDYVISVDEIKSIHGPVSPHFPCVPNQYVWMAVSVTCTWAITVHLRLQFGSYLFFKPFICYFSYLMAQEKKWFVAFRWQWLIIGWTDYYNIYTNVAEFGNPWIWNPWKCGGMYFKPLHFHQNLYQKFWTKFYFDNFDLKKNVKFHFLIVRLHCTVCTSSTHL